MLRFVKRMLTISDRSGPTLLGGRRRTDSFGAPDHLSRFELATLVSPLAFGVASWRIGRGAHSLVALLACVLLTGCPRSQTDVDPQAEFPLRGLELRVLVVDDERLASAIQKVRGEWNAQTKAELVAEVVAADDLEQMESLPCDALIIPSAMLGPLAESERIQPVADDSIRQSEGYWSGVFELLRLRESVWDRQVYGVPFGSPVLTLYCRPELLEKIGRKPPTTWTEFQDLAELLAKRETLGPADNAADAPWHGVMLPLGPGWAGKVLLAWAAPYAKHRDNFSTWFDIATMEPLVDRPPMVHALEELVEAARLGPPEQTEADPATVREAFWRGECGMAVSWPDRSAAIEVDRDATPPVEFVELPGAADVYDVAEKQWSRRRNDEDVRVPLLAVAGRIGAIARSSDHPEAALELLYWLSTGALDGTLSAASQDTTLFARKQMAFPQRWVEAPVSAMAAARYAATTQETFSRQTWLFALRIPGREQYFAALDEAVRQAVAGKKTPQQALGDAAHKWREITKTLGVQPQREAYLHSLGLKLSEEP